MKKLILHLLLFLPCIAVGQSTNNLSEEMTPGMIHAVGAIHGKRMGGSFYLL